jgi:hypothetical protein
MYNIINVIDNSFQVKACYGLMNHVNNIVVFPIIIMFGKV